MDDTTYMLWYDGDPERGLAEKVERAVAYYTAKYGAAPTTCFVNPDVLAGQELLAGSVRLHPSRTVLRDHFWVGVELEGQS